MAILEIVTYPDPILRTVCDPVESITDDIVELIDNMVETMYAFPGTVGLAAPQVGVSKRIIVLDTTSKTTKDQLLVLINPVITESSKNKYVREGCLSVPEYLGDVKRAQKIIYTALDRHGNMLENEAKYFEAVVIQHEIDHLDGILFIDKINRLKTDLIRRQST